MEDFLKKVKHWLGKVQNLPLFGSMAEDLMTFLDMLSDYCRGVYRDLPRGVLIAGAVSLGYALFPIDLILDVIPFIGYLDDAAILMLLLDFFIARDLLRYRSWKEALREKGLRALRENCTAEILQLLKNKHLAAAFLTEEKKIRLLLCDPKDRRKPLPCKSLPADIPGEKLAALGAESWEAIGGFYTELFRDPRINWSYLGMRPFMPEYDPQANTDDFVID